MNDTKVRHNFHDVVADSNVLCGKVGSNVVLEAWDRAAKGQHEVVDANIQSSYLDVSSAERPANQFWTPVLEGSRVLGGEAAIWPRATLARTS